MNPPAIPPALAALDPNALPESELRAALVTVLSFCDVLVAFQAELIERGTQLEVENARLKGEHPPRPRGTGEGGGTKPASDAAGGHSSEEARGQAETKSGVRQRKRKRPKLPRLRITHEIYLPRPPDLPADAQYKGREPKVVQEVEIHVKVCRFWLMKFHSRSTGRTYYSKMPPGYKGEFGPGVRTWGLALHHYANVTTPLLHGLFRRMGLDIGKSTVTRLVTERLKPFHEEAQDVLKAGLASTWWQHHDVTSTRVKDEWYACHVIANALHTTYRTTPRQDRESVIDALRGGAPRRYRWDEMAEGLLRVASIPNYAFYALCKLGRGQEWDSQGMTEMLATTGAQFTDDTRKLVLDAMAIAAYRAAGDWPVVPCLLTDDAKQGRGITELHALCWVHDARHYNKLLPARDCQRAVLAEVQDVYWRFYGELLKFQKKPSPEEAVRLEQRFDELFTRVTGYAALDGRLAKTLANKPRLLLVLKYPELPLHNNAAEIAARRRVRRRHQSLGPQSAHGLKAWDTFQSLCETAQKLGVSFLDYLQDRITTAGQVPRLDALIAAKAAELRLNMSWNSG